jgi:DNA repair exonuclease SbcCD ATPase subunit
MDETFFTRPHQDRSTFERKYLERFRNATEKHVGLPGLSPALMEKQREMDAADRRLEQARIKLEQWKVNFQRKRKEIQEQQQAVDEETRQLAILQVQHQAELKKTKDREQDELDKARQIEKDLKQLSEREESLRMHNDRLTAELSELQPCAEYLQSVVDSCQTFDNIEAILHRYDSLAATRVEFLDRYQELMRKFGVDQKELTKLLAITRSHVIDWTMQFNARLAKIKQTKKLNEYRNAHRIKDVQRVDEKNTELAAIKISIRAIYTRAVSRSSAAAIDIQKKRGDISEEAMLEYIENRFLDLRDIIRDSTLSGPSSMI